MATLTTQMRAKDAFFAGPPDENSFRICFTASSERDLPEAIRLLAEAFHGED